MFLPGENSLEKRRCFCTYFSRLFFPLLYHAIEYSLKFFVFSYVCSSSRSTLLVSLVATAIQVDLVLCVLKTTPQSLRRHLDFLSLSKYDYEIFGLVPLSRILDLHGYIFTSLASGVQLVVDGVRDDDFVCFVVAVLCCIGVV